MVEYLYLHGFASSPRSRKAEYLKEHLQTEFNISLKTPNLNQGDFSQFTITRAINEAKSFIEESDTSWVLIGSSLGGLMSAILAEEFPQIERLILLAPAFDFLSLWRKRLGEDTLKQWQENGYYPVYHYGEKKSLPLDYQFVIDAEKYFTTTIQRQLPTLIIHGTKDETIPVKVSRDYAISRAWVELVELESDHNLTDVLPEVWQYLQNTIPASK